MKVQPYLSFDGRCEEAVEFYRSALGAEVVMLMRFKDMPDPAERRKIPHGTENKVMHACFRIGETEVMASDGQSSGQPSFKGITLSIAVGNDAEADRVFANLADGGQVQVPLTKTFFSSRFGILADRFGVPWMIVVQS